MSGSKEFLHTASAAAAGLLAVIARSAVVSRSGRACLGRDNSSKYSKSGERRELLLHVFSIAP
jgi:hypothetical protein